MLVPRPASSVHAPGPILEPLRPEDIRLPQSFHAPADQRLPLARRAHERLASGDADRNWVGIHAVHEHEAKQIIALTYGMISLIDDCVGQVLAALTRLGLAEDTVLVFTSDHGDWMADHGLIQKGPLHYRGLIRVPFLWADPRARRKASHTAELAGSIDLARTFLDRAGLAPYNGMQGHSLLGIAERGEASRHDGLIVEQATQRPMPGFDRPIRVWSFVDRDWRITLWPDPKQGELYNLKADPCEMTNLWDDLGSREKRNELVHRMLLKTIELQDWAPLQTQEA